MKKYEDIFFIHPFVLGTELRVRVFLAKNQMSNPADEYLDRRLDSVPDVLPVALADLAHDLTSHRPAAIPK